MAVEGCGKCVKYLLFIFNFLFFISGCAILAIGIFLHVEAGGFATLVQSLPFLNAANICIAAGIIVMFVAFLGCCGAIKENACMLLMFFCFLLLIFLLEIVAGIVGFIYRNQVQDAVTNDLIKGLDNYNKTNEPGTTKAWDVLQTEFKCCGVNSSADWGRSKSIFNGSETPDSCCVNKTNGCGRDASKETFAVGCKDLLIYFMESKIYYIAAGGIAIGVFQILGMIFSMVLYTGIKRGSYA